MTTEELINLNLGFLIEEYGFTFEFYNEHGSHYIFKNANGHIEFYEWEQFKDHCIFVKCGTNERETQLYYEYPEIFNRFQETHKGFKWFFKDERPDYWAMVSDIVRNEIKTKNSIFGLNI